MKKDAGKIIKDGKILTPKFRIDWPNICEKRPVDADMYGGKYTCTAIWEVDKTDFSLLNKAIQEAGKSHGKGFKKPIRSGEEKEEWDGYGEGTKFATLSANKFKPTVVFADKTVCDSDDMIIPGSYARAVISAWPYSNVNKGVALNLHAVQLLGGGRRLAKGIDGMNDDLADEVFDEEEMEDTEESLDDAEEYDDDLD